jgi:hypothetical protein
VKELVSDENLSKLSWAGSDEPEIPPVLRLQDNVPFLFRILEILAEDSQDGLAFFLEVSK